LKGVNLNKNFDREYQHKVLTILANDYPNISDATGEWWQQEIKNNLGVYATNVKYLEDHGLVKDGLKISFDQTGRPYLFQPKIPSITAKGIDFLSDDGGLSAILNVQTVKIHEESIKALVTLCIKNSSLSQEEKDSFIKAVKNLPAEGLKHLLTRLIDLGLSCGPQLSDLIQKLL